MGQTLLEVIKDHCEAVGASSFTLGYSLDGRSINKVDIFIHTGSVWDKTDKCTLQSYPDEQKAIEGIQALINLKKAEA